MSFDTLKPEIWYQILSYFTPPMFKHLSGWTQEEATFEAQEVYDALPKVGSPGTTSRGDLRRGSDTLAKLARTSIAFNHIATAHLYARIVTDRFISLTSNLNSPPAHPQIERKSELLHRTRHLQLEYPRVAREPTYHDIMMDGYNSFDGIDPDCLSTWALADAALKLDQLHIHLQRLTKRNSILFPNARRLSFGAVFGAQSELWRNVGPMDKGKASDKIVTSNEMLGAIFRRSPLQLVCQRSHMGPFAMSWTYSWSTTSPSLPISPDSPLFTIHVEGDRCGAPAVAGGLNRWIFERNPRTQHHFFELVKADVISTIRGMKGHRGRLHQSDVGLDIEIYASCSQAGPPGVPVQRVRNSDLRRLSLQEEKEATRKTAVTFLEEAVEQRLWSKFTSDVISWRDLGSAPRCQACGWEDEREE